MVIFDPAYVVPLFVASGQQLRRFCNCDRCLGIEEVDAWLPNSGHDGLMFWPRGWTARHGRRKMLSSARRKTESGSCGDELFAKHVSRKGSHAHACTRQKRVSRRGHRPSQRSESPPSSHSFQKSLVCKALVSKRARATLKRELQHNFAEELLFRRLS